MDWKKKTYRTPKYTIVYSPTIVSRDINPIRFFTNPKLIFYNTLLVITIRGQQHASTRIILLHSRIEMKFEKKNSLRPPLYSIIIIYYSRNAVYTCKYFFENNILFTRTRYEHVNCQFVDALDYGVQTV